MTRDEAFLKITEELTHAETALREGYEGRARANARRAVGHALAWWLETHPRKREAWPRAAFDRLRVFKDEASIPAAVRAAARLLTLPVEPRPDAEHLVPEEMRELVKLRTEQINPADRIPREMNPLELARVIIDWVEADAGNDGIR